MDKFLVKGYAASKKGQALKAFNYPMPELGEHEVRVSTSHCGLCYTDIQAIDDFYRITNYPFVPGHEIVGYISEIGKSVKGLKEGDRVGIGWQGRACMHCEWCLRGEANMCQEIVDDASWTPYGGFSTSIAVDSGFAYLLPEGMPSEDGAVFMCAGITVFTPLRSHYSTPGLRIGIIGVGGLGHLAIQYAKALGYEVTAISSSPAKKTEALALGADYFIQVNDGNAIRKAAYYFDLLLCTAHAGIDWEDVLGMLKRKGKLILVGFQDMRFRPIDLIAHQLSIYGSFLGTQQDMKEMLAFSSAHSIHPMIELLPMRQINAAIARLKENKVRYRMVLFNEDVARE